MILVIMITIIIMITMTISPQDCFTFVLFADALDGKFPLEMIEIKKKTRKKFQKYTVSIDSVPFKNKSQLLQPSRRLHAGFPSFPLFNGGLFFPFGFPFSSSPFVFGSERSSYVSNIEMCYE